MHLNKNAIERVTTECTSKEILIGTIVNSLSCLAGPGNGRYSQAAITVTMVLLVLFPASPL